MTTVSTTLSVTANKLIIYNIKGGEKMSISRDDLDDYPLYSPADDCPMSKSGDCAECPYADECLVYAIDQTRHQNDD